MEFSRPPEAPVFEPTTEEFQDPAAYISKIRSVAEQVGICKIRPPSNWQPPFAIDIDNFRFTPRIQRLNELEANTRIKLNFLEHLAKFWELQGMSLKIPSVERKYLDLYCLHKAVQTEGGFETVSREKKWQKIAERLCCESSRANGNTLRQHYEKTLYPYDIFLAGTSADNKDDAGGDKDLKVSVKDESKSPAAAAAATGKKEATDGSILVKKVDFSLNNELKKLQFFGAGPKTALADVICIGQYTQYLIVVGFSKQFFLLAINRFALSFTDIR
jgi:histone demethylase JARID1